MYQRLYNMDILIIIIILVLLLFIICFYYFNKKSKHRRKRETAQRVYEKIKSFAYNGQKINYLRKIDAFVFEEFLLDCFERKGYRVIRNKKYTGDGGIDGKVIINNMTYLVQAKRYSSHINKKHIQDFIRLVESKRVKGFFIHTGRTGQGCKEITFNSPNVQIISGNRLLDLIEIETKIFNI